MFGRIFVSNLQLGTIIKSSKLWWNDLILVQCFVPNKLKRIWNNYCSNQQDKHNLDFGSIIVPINEINKIWILEQLLFQTKRLTKYDEIIYVHFMKTHWWQRKLNTSLEPRVTSRLKIIYLDLYLSYGKIIKNGLFMDTKSPSVHKESISYKKYLVFWL